MENQNEMSPWLPPGTGPLAGVRVVDLTHMLAGPYCTWVMGGLGADVIKVERPGTGDFTRAIAPFLHGHSIYFLGVNRNKRSITLNLKAEQGKEILRRLAADADVLVENNRPGVMDRLGLGSKDLAAVNPRLVYASVSGFGQTGPPSAKPAFDAMVQAFSGMMSVTGEPDGPPLRVGTSIGDIGSSLFATIGILAALQERNRTGKGTFVDVAMLDSQLVLLENAIGRYLNAGDLPRRLGSRHPLVAPFQAFPTRDEPIVVCVDTEEQWARLCKAMGLDPLIADPRSAMAISESSTTRSWSSACSRSSGAGPGRSGSRSSRPPTSPAAPSTRSPTSARTPTSSPAT